MAETPRERFAARRPCTRPGPASSRSTRCGAVNGEGAYANLVLGRLLGERRLSARDAAFATELLAGTCRRQGTYDLVIERAGRRKLSSLQPAVLDLLRLGTHQLLGMRVPTHAAVGATVDLAGATVGQRVPGLVNAVLRRVAAHDYDGWVDELTAGLDRVAALAVRYAHPRWIVDAFAERAARRRARAGARGGQREPGALSGGTAGARGGRRAAGGGRDRRAAGRRSPPVGRATRPSAPAVAQGRAGVQDEGSQLVAWGLSRPTRGSGDLARPLRRARAARPPCWPVWPEPRTAGCCRPSSARTGPAWSPPPSGRTPSRDRWWSSPTAPGPPGGRARSPGCWPTSRAPASARCGAGRSRAGADRPPTSKRCSRCSGRC